MTSITKKITAALLAVIAVVCLAVGLRFTTRFAAADGTDGSTVTLTDTDYLDIDAGVFKGLKDKDSGNTVAKLLENKNLAIALPASVTSVADGTGSGTGAKSVLGSYSNKLTTLTLPSSLKTIGKYSFANCKSLDDISVASATGLETISEGAFYGCSMLQSITIPANVKTIGSSAFSGCTSVSAINYRAKNVSAMLASPFGGVGRATVVIDGTGDAITSLPTNLFRGTGIVSAEFKNVKLSATGTFGQEIFSDCKNLKSVTFDGNCQILEIGNEAFNGCETLEGITFPSGLKTIGENSFKGCASLLQITLPSTVTAIGTGAFSGCSILEVINKSTHITVRKDASNGGVGQYAENIVTSEADSKMKVDGDFLFFDLSGDARLLRYSGSDTSVTLPTTTANYAVYKNAFRGNNTLTQVVIPDKVISLGENAFMNCTALKAVSIPKTINPAKSGNAVFYGCTSLTDVTFGDSGNCQDSLNKILTQMFMNCTSLTRIVIPSSVNEIYSSAFEGCTKLEKVEFAPYKNASNKTCYRLQIFGNSAFKGCVSLKSITIPQATALEGTKVSSSLEASAFEGCTSLNTVIIPANANMSSSTVFKSCPTTLVIVAPDKSAYEVYKNETSYPELENLNVTYNVALTLKNIGANAPADKTIYRYYNIAGQTLPVQDGYKTSVWYKTNSGGVLSGKLTQEELDNLLATANIESTDVYAYYTEKPAITAPQIAPLDYVSGEEKLNTSNLQTWFPSLGTNVGINAESMTGYLYTAKIDRYVDMSGDSSLAGNMMDAGKYTLSLIVNNPDDRGEWTGGIPFEVSIAPAVLSDPEEIEWGVVDGNGLTLLMPNGSSGVETQVKLYRYGNKWYSEKQYSAESVELPHDSDYEITVSRQYVIWNDAEKTVKLTKDGISNYFEVLQYNGNVEHEGGRYTAVATVKMKNNYALDTNQNTAFETYGLSVTDKRVNNTYEINKVWYIVSTKANRLLSGDVDYYVNGWQYMSGSGNPKAPTLVVGDVRNLTFTLDLYKNQDRNERLLDTLEFAYADFPKYVNGSMPAGYYVLTVNIPNVFEGGVTYEGGTYVVTFNVADAYVSSLTELRDEGGKPYIENSQLNPINGATVFADWTGSVAFGVDKTNMPLLGLPKEILHRTERTGIWADTGYTDKFYSGFVIKYSVGTGAYLPESGYTSSPVNIGSYNGVRYKLSAPGYGEIEGSYNLRIMGAVGADLEEGLAAMNVKYTGNTVTLNFDGFVNNSNYFEAVYLDDGNQYRTNLREKLKAGGYIAKNTERDYYMNSGVHYVVLFIRDQNIENAKWANGVTTVKLSGYKECVVLEFEIAKADNSTVVTPSIRDWTWGAFDEEVNVPSWTTAFNTEKNYKLVSKTDPQKVYWFNAGEGEADFSAALPGDYWLKPVAGETANVKRYSTEGKSESDNEWASVTIAKATPIWEVAPHVGSLKYGDDAGLSAPKGSLLEVYADVADKWETYVCTADDFIKADDNKYAYTTFAELKAAKGGHIPAGEWVFFYKLEEDEKYAEWVEPIYFSVLGGDNYWDVTPVIHDPTRVRPCLRSEHTI